MASYYIYEVMDRDCAAKDVLDKLSSVGFTDSDLMKVLVARYGLGSESSSAANEISSKAENELKQYFLAQMFYIIEQSECYYVRADNDKYKDFDQAIQKLVYACFRYATAKISWGGKRESDARNVLHDAMWDMIRERVAQTPSDFTNLLSSTELENAIRKELKAKSDQDLKCAEVKVRENYRKKFKALSKISESEVDQFLNWKKFVAEKSPVQLPESNSEISELKEDCFCPLTQKKELNDWIGSNLSSPYVYFVRDKRGLIKIGFTVGNIQRIRGYGSSIPGGVEVLAIVYVSDMRDEAAYHKRFASSRVNGEWFRPTPDILAEISRIRSEALHVKDW